MITHTALDAVVFSAGVETVGSNTRGSTINGLPTTAINITLDGMNVQDKRGNEGFFMMDPPDDGLGGGNHRVDVDARRGRVGRRVPRASG